jgi:hypothetical protein
MDDLVSSIIGHLDECGSNIIGDENLCAKEGFVRQCPTRLRTPPLPSEADKAERNNMAFGSV